MDGNEIVELVWEFYQSYVRSTKKRPTTVAFGHNEIRELQIYFSQNYDYAYKLKELCEEKKFMGMKVEELEKETYIEVKGE